VDGFGMGMPYSSFTSIVGTSRRLASLWICRRWFEVTRGTCVAGVVPETAASESAIRVKLLATVSMTFWVAASNPVEGVGGFEFGAVPAAFAASLPFFPLPLALAAFVAGKIFPLAWLFALPLP